jgi:hypothetical protein
MAMNKLNGTQVIVDYPIRAIRSGVMGRPG